MRTMVDSTTTVDEPKTADIACAYINGSFGVQTAASMEALFPHSKYGWCFIDVNGSRPDADARDWETGDKSGSLETWVIEHNKHTGKKDAVVYCNRSTIAEVRQLTGSQILGVDYWLWIATLDGTIYQAPGVVACQNKGENQTGGHFDSSVVFSDQFWLPVASPAPAPAPVPVPTPPKRPSCVQLQRSIRIAADNLWGPETDKACNAIASASVYVGQKFPSGVVYTQERVGTIADGWWGPRSKECLIATTMNFQRALAAMGFSPGAIDGQWGPKTQSAYNAARNACHI